MKNISHYLWINGTQQGPWKDKQQTIKTVVFIVVVYLFCILSPSNAAGLDDGQWTVIGEFDSEGIHHLLIKSKYQNDNGRRPVLIVNDKKIYADHIGIDSKSGKTFWRIPVWGINFARSKSALYRESTLNSKERPALVMIINDYIIDNILKEKD